MNWQAIAAIVVVLGAVIAATVWMMNSSKKHRFAAASGPVVGAPPQVPAGRTVAVGRRAGAPKNPVHRRKLPAGPIPGSVIDQHFFGHAIGSANLHAADEAETFRVGITGKLTGVAFWAATQTMRKDHVVVEVRPTRNGWPMETDALALVRGRAVIPAGSMETPVFKYHRVIVRFRRPLKVRAGQELAMVVLAEKKLSTWLALGHDSSYAGGLWYQYNLYVPGWENDPVVQSGMYFQTFVQPSPGLDRSGMVSPSAVTLRRRAHTPPITYAALGKNGLPVLYNTTRVHFTKAMWQLLPHRVAGLALGTDHRIWMTYRTIFPLKAAVCERVVERQFKRRHPLILEWTPVLFGPGKWVWFVDFYGDKPSTVYGFNGRTWVRHSLKTGIFLAKQLGHFEPAPPQNAVVEGNAFFSTQGGVIRFSGKTWSRKQFWRSGNSGHAPFLASDPDGKGLVASTPYNAHRLWHWRGGHWRPIGIPRSFGDRVIYALAPITDHSAWVRTGNNGLGRIHYLARARAPLNIPGVIKQYARTGDKKIEARLLHMGPAIFPLVAQFAEKLSLEHKPGGRALNALAERLHQGFNYKTIRLGRYSASFFHCLRPLGGGKAVVGAVNVTGPGRTRRSGMFILGPGTRVMLAHAHVGPAFGDIFSQMSDVHPAGPHAFWLTNVTPGAYPVEISEVTGREIRVADIPMRYVFGCTPQGTLFLGSDTYNPSIAIFNYRGAKPPPPDSFSHQTLLSRQWRIIKKNPPTVLAMDGTGKVWAYSIRRGAEYFDGRSWHVVPGAIMRDPRGAPEAYEAILGAAHGAVFCSPPAAHQYSARQVYLVNRHRVVASGSLRSLIRSKRAALARFLGPPAYRPLLASTGFRTFWMDKKNHVWASSYGIPAFYHHHAWHKLRPHSAAQAVLCGFADGSRMFLGTGHGAYLLWLKGGKLQQKIIAKGQNFVHMPDFTPRMTGRNDLWLSETRDAGYENIGKLLTPRGVVDETPGGFVACINSGNIWMRQVAPGVFATQRVFKIWHKGRETSQIKFPGSAVTLPHFFSEKPGSVLGVNRYLAVRYDQIRPGVYRMGRSYFPPPYAGNATDCQYSPLGFLYYSSGTAAYIAILSHRK